jgi:hypothetical protein
MTKVASPAIILMSLALAIYLSGVFGEMIEDELSIVPFLNALAVSS